MFGNLFKGFKVAKVATEVHRLLMKNYGLQADLNKVALQVERLSEWTSTNPHEIAIFYVANQIERMERSNPTHADLAKKYIRVSKKAYEVGAAKQEWALDILKTNAWEKLGINIANIEAASL